MESLGTLTYRELQAFAKRHGVKANGSRVDLIQRLVRDTVWLSMMLSVRLGQFLYSKHSIRGFVPVLLATCNSLSTSTE